MSKRIWRWAAAVIAFAAVAITCYLNLTASAVAADGPAQRIEIEARKFEFGPKEFRVRKGQRVTVVLTSRDFVHGFGIPDFNVRADAIPGKTIEITFVADKISQFIYLCDNFCGEGHDKMSGFLTVSES